MTGTEDNATVFVSAVLAKTLEVLLIQQVFSGYISLDSLPHRIFISTSNEPASSSLSELGILFKKISTFFMFSYIKTTLVARHINLVVS